MKRTSLSIASSLLLVTPLIAHAQTKAPIATYWLSAETSNGFSMSGGAPSMADMASLMMGGGMGSSHKRMLLQLGSLQAASGDPAADHFVPPTLNMGNSLPLKTPPRDTTPRERSEEKPDNYERPKGRLLLFWGCGTNAGPGQPVIIDFAKVAAGQWPANIFTRRVNIARGPAPSRSRTYGEWPNSQDSTRVPGDASLRGEHQIKGNYSPDIRFKVEQLDFLSALEPSMSKSSEGALNVRWSSVSGSTGYFANVMGSDGKDDMVWWVSSSSREFGEALFDYIAPGEVSKLVKDKVVMPPSTTECTVPKEVMAAAPNGMLRMIAYGEEANFAYPPRPQDPKAPWNPEWVAKVRVKSTSMQPIMESEGRSGGRNRRSSDEGGGSVPGVGNVIRGIFGF